jgi:hypothetical protein
MGYLTKTGLVTIFISNPLWVVLEPHPSYSPFEMSRVHLWECPDSLLVALE